MYQKRDLEKKNGKLEFSSLDLVSGMKPLVIDGKYRFILSGSLLGVPIKDIVLNPLGYLDEVRMFPLDFEEYLLNKNVGEESINYLRNCFYNKKEVPPSLNALFLDYFREYILMGGMPEAIEEFNKSKNLFNVSNVQNQILNKYSYDITTYLDDDEKS